MAGAITSASCAKDERTPEFAGASSVAVLKASSYAGEIEMVIRQGLSLCGLMVKGRNVVLKPNLVEYDRHTAINTHPAVVAAAMAAFRGLGASSVRIAEGPGHRRDTLGLAEEAGYFETFRGFERDFIDLNRDNVSAVRGFAGLPTFYFPDTILGADLIVSIPKMKTHHWAAATLSMKNLFGVTPGSIYGWPKNTLHYIGIPKAIVALNRQFRNTFAIVDGIVGMEGNGPIQGTPKAAGVLVFGSNLVAVDATCCRIMGIDAERVPYLNIARDLGAVAETQIEQRGERPASARTDFELGDGFKDLRLG